MEKSVSFRGRRTGAKDSVQIAPLGESSRDFLERVESTAESSDLE